VVSVELSPDSAWDIVPDVRIDTAAYDREVRGNIDYLRNAYWFAHERFQSQARVHYGDIYNMPATLGRFDLAVICAVLLHVRDPLRVVEGCTRLADSLVITDMHYPEIPQDAAYMKFSPHLFVRFGEVLGFTSNTVSYSEQLYIADGTPRPGPLFTVVSTRS
jgi:hypothetical protein